MDYDQLTKTLDAILMTSDKPITIDRLMNYFEADANVNRANIREAIQLLHQLNQDRGFELKEVSNGYRYQSKIDYQEWVGRHFDVRPPRYSRALLEILSLIIYRQPITRAEIEEVRGVAVSSNIIKTLIEREWIRIIGHKEVPGRPAMFGTTRELLDYFNLKSLDDMPDLDEIKDLDSWEASLNLPDIEDEATKNNSDDHETTADMKDLDKEKHTDN